MGGVCSLAPLGARHLSQLPLGKRKLQSFLHQRLVCCCLVRVEGALALSLTPHTQALCCLFQASKLSILIFSKGSCNRAESALRLFLRCEMDVDSVALTTARWLPGLQSAWFSFQGSAICASALVTFAFWKSKCDVIAIFLRSKHTLRASAGKTLKTGGGG